MPESDLTILPHFLLWASRPVACFFRRAADCRAFAGGLGRRRTAVALFEQGNLLSHGELFTAAASLQAEPAAVVRTPLAHLAVGAGMFLRFHRLIVPQLLFSWAARWRRVFLREEWLAPVLISRTLLMLPR